MKITKIKKQVSAEVQYLQMMSEYFKQQAEAKRKLLEVLKQMKPFSNKSV